MVAEKVCKTQTLTKCVFFLTADRHDVKFEITKWNPEFFYITHSFTLVIRVLTCLHTWWFVACMQAEKKS